MPKRKDQDIPLLDLQRRRFSFDPQVPTTNTKQVKNAILTGQKVKAPGKSHLHARMEPSFEFQGMKHIC